MLHGLSPDLPARLSCPPLTARPSKSPARPRFFSDLPAARLSQLPACSCSAPLHALLIWSPAHPFTSSSRPLVPLSSPALL